MKRLQILLILLFALALSASALANPGKAKGHDRAKPGKPAAAEIHNGVHGEVRGPELPDAHIDIDIGIGDVRPYAEEFGYTGYEALPPGIARNYARGKPLPPGIARKQVPGPLLERLPVYPDYHWQVIGQDLVLIDPDNVVAEIINGVFR